MWTTKAQRQRTDASTSRNLPRLDYDGIIATLLAQSRLQTGNTSRSYGSSTQWSRGGSSGHKHSLVKQSERRSLVKQSKAHTFFGETVREKVLGEIVRDTNILWWNSPRKSLVKQSEAHTFFGETVREKVFGETVRGTNFHWCKSPRKSPW